MGKECEDFILHNVDGTTVDKVTKRPDFPKTSGIDQISNKLLKDCCPVIPICLTKITNLSIFVNKLIIKPLFTKGNWELS